MLLTTYQFVLFADYHQFYLQDEQAEGSLADAWTKEASNNMLAIASNVVGVRTAHNFTVPVTLEICDDAPNDDLSAWDRVNECSIDVPSGHLVIAGCTDYFPEAARIALTPGCYRTRIYYGGLATVDVNDLEGEDRYQVTMWPAAYAPPQVLKH